MARSKNIPVIKLVKSRKPRSTVNFRKFLTPSNSSYDGFSFVRVQGDMWKIENKKKGKARIERNVSLSIGDCNRRITLEFNTEERNKDHAIKKLKVLKDAITELEKFLTGAPPYNCRLEVVK